MAVKNLASLVLRCSTVLPGGVVSNPRLGTGYTANAKSTETRISLRYTSHSPEQEFQPAGRLWHADDRMDRIAASRAGRLSCCAGVLRQGVGIR
jgi:hypothetical protein